VNLVVERRPPQGDMWADFATTLANTHHGEWRTWSDLVALRAQARLAGDAPLARLAAAGLIVTGHHFRRFEYFDDALLDLLPLCAGADGLDPPQELLALNGLLLGLLLCKPLDPSIDDCSTRLQGMLERGLDVNLTLSAARTLIYHFDSRNLREPALRVQSLISARMAEPDATPYRRAQWLNLWRRCAHYGVQPQLADQALAQMRELAATHGLRDVEFAAHLADVDNALPRGDIQAARAAIERAEALLDPVRLGELVQLELAKTRLAHMRGEADSALHHASRALRLGQELKMPPTTLSAYALNEALARCLGEDFEGARKTLQDLVGLLTAGYADEVHAMLQGIDAYLAVRDKLPDARQRLEALWRGLRERRSYDLFDGLPEFGARLCVLALERDIETDFVRSLISKRQLAPPDHAPASWPWALRIQAFGGFALWRDGEPLATAGKAQRKPLALLQALVAHGAFEDGSGVEVARLVELLWPDVEAADPRSSFEVTLSRLRKWLGVDQALKLSNGRLSLNPRLVWCDVAAFEHTCTALHRALLPHADASHLPALLNQLGPLYAGKLFGSAALEPWQVLARERQAMRFTRLVREAGLHLETRQRWNEALDLYETGLLQDLLAEPLHLALIRCQLALGRKAEARRAIERCVAVLNAELGLAPGAEIRELSARLDAPLDARP
jgi:LuxR family maltose regulon positive regulatory protein